MGLSNNQNSPLEFLKNLYYSDVSPLEVNIEIYGKSTLF